MFSRANPDRPMSTQPELTTTTTTLRNHFKCPTALLLFCHCNDERLDTKKRDNSEVEMGVCACDFLGFGCHRTLSVGGSRRNPTTRDSKRIKSTPCLLTSQEDGNVLCLIRKQGRWRCGRRVVWLHYGRYRCRRRHCYCCHHGCRCLYCCLLFWVSNARVGCCCYALVERSSVCATIFFFPLMDSGM